MLVLFQTKPSSVFWVLQVEDMIMAHKTWQHLDSSALDLNQLSADFSVDFIQNLFQNCCLNDSHKMRVSFLKMRCFPLIWDAIFAFIGCFGEVSLATWDYISSWRGSFHIQPEHMDCFFLSVLFDSFRATWHHILVLSYRSIHHSKFIMKKSVM